MQQCDYVNDFSQSRTIYLNGSKELLNINPLTGSSWNEGLFSVSLEKNKMIIVNKGKKQMAIRVVVEANSHIPQGIIVYRRPLNQNSDPQTADLMAGKQVHYYVVKSGQILNVLISPEAVYSSLRVRLVQISTGKR